MFSSAVASYDFHTSNFDLHIFQRYAQIVCCSCYTDEDSADVKIEADSNDVTEYPAHYDQSSIGMIFCCILCSHLSHMSPESCRIDQLT